ncbi:MAG: hypothetical protein KH366_19505, partial [Clostridiaceae bacterium]|nr:hypothetical protein [Clostridiaceae bacterium]
AMEKACEENNIKFEYLGFDGGAVQMEAYESWDIGVTGIGGVLSGTVGHDAVVLGACLTDSATQNFYAASDSAIVKAGQGNNTISETVYGDAESWKNAEILSGYGDVKHYCLAKTLEGFGLKIEDVNVLWMDPSTCITSYFGGQGDVAAVYGAMTYNQDVQKLTKVICGNDMDLGLMGNLIGNAKSISDPKKYDAMKKTIKLYYQNLEWIRDNKEEAKTYMEDYYNYIGVEYTDEKAENVLNNEHYYTLEENIKDLLVPSSQDNNINVMQQKLADVARFYEGVDVYEKGTAEKFLKPEHFNFNMITEIYNER